MVRLIANILKEAALLAGNGLMPDQNTMKEYFRMGAKSVTLATAGGGLIALGIAASLGGLAVYLIEEGLRATVALPLVGGICILLGILAFMAGRNIFRDILDRDSGEAAELVPNTSDIGDTVGKAFQLFVEGFCEEPVISPVHKASATGSGGHAKDSSGDVMSISSTTSVYDDTVH